MLSFNLNKNTLKSHFNCLLDIGLFYHIAIPAIIKIATTNPKWIIVILQDFNICTHDKSHCYKQLQVAYCFNKAILHFAKFITSADSSPLHILTFYITLSSKQGQTLPQYYIWPVISWSTDFHV